MRALSFAAATLAASLASTSATAMDLVSFPIDTTEGLVAVPNGTLDTDADGNTSLKIVATEAMTVPLAVVRDVVDPDQPISYSARLKSEGLEGNAYLELWVGIAGMGEFFSRGLNDPITGTSDWVGRAVPFKLEPQHDPELYRLNLVITGPGTVWIDDLKIATAP